LEFSIRFFFLEEKEKRRDQFEKEVQMIINAEQQKAEEMARRFRTKVTKQGLVDNEAYHLPIYHSVRKSREYRVEFSDFHVLQKEQNSSGEDAGKSQNNQPMETSIEIKPTTSKLNATIGSDNQAASSILPSKNLIPLIKTFFILLIFRNSSSYTFNQESRSY
jgi:hypothetical protein